MYEQLVREYGYVFVIIRPLVIVWSSRECVCSSIVFPRDMLQFDVVLL